MYKFESEIQDENITRLGTSAIIDFYKTLSIDSLQNDDVYSFATGVNSMFLNVVIDVRKNRTNSADLISSCADFFANHSVPWAWFVTPSNTNDMLDNNLSLIEEAPARYFDLADQLPSIPNNLEIQELSTPDDLKSWIIPIKEGFGADPNDDSFRLLNLRILQNNCQTLKHFVLYYENDIASSGTLFISKDVVMLHNLAT